MGGQFSKNCVTDPAQVGTQVSPDSDSATEDVRRWKQYDYIVIGGGTAGCVMASRLSENLGATVLLIEAGKSDGGLFTRLPLPFTKSYRSDVDWAYTSVPQKLMGGKVVDWPRGKVLGGTSLLNASIYTRSSPEDFDEWEKAGATGWSYKDLEQYFRRAEGFNPNRPRFSKLDLHTKGQAGPVEIGQTEDVAPIIRKINDACRNMGVPFIEDVNNTDRLIGSTHLPGTVDSKGERVTSASAYLTPEVLSRPNLTIATNMFVEKILFSKTSPPRAIGIQLASSKSSPSYRVAAGKEVILSAGVIGSPQLLLLSGVGPKEELDKLNITCVKDSPHVGKHFLDHTSSGPMIFRVKPGYTIDYLNSPLSAIFALLKWLIFGTGPMSRMSINSVAFLRSDDPKLVDTTVGDVKDLSSGPNSPDIEIMWAPAIVPAYNCGGRSGEHGITIASVALKQESEGSVTLKTNSVWDYPDIDGNFLSSENDVNVILRGARFIMRMVRTEPLKSVMDLRPNDHDETDYFWPGDVDPDKISDDELRKWIMRHGYPACHPVSWNVPDGGSPETSVVDPELKVHGVTGLRIMDASMFSTQISAHPVAVIYAAAEKLADMIKGGHTS